MDAKLHVAFTMDCERIASESPPGGPETWEFSEASIRAFCRLLLDRDIHPTLFLTPECTRQHAPLLSSLSRRGVDLGLHIHPQSLGERTHDLCLGQYSLSEQEEMISEGIHGFREALGFRPLSFRPGNFSASTGTFGLLASMGFQQGSVSDPGRAAPDLAAFWVGACRHPHWASDEDMLVPGRLPFLEVPVTTDPERRHPNGFPHELRIESGPLGSWHKPIIGKALRWMTQNRIESPTLCLFTHNFIDYSDYDSPHRATLLGILDFLKRLGAEYDMVTVNLRDLHDLYAQAFGPPE